MGKQGKSRGKVELKARQKRQVLTLLFKNINTLCGRQAGRTTNTGHGAEATPRRKFFLCLDSEQKQILYVLEQAGDLHLLSVDILGNQNRPGKCFFPATLVRPNSKESEACFCVSVPTVFIFFNAKAVFTQYCRG